MRTADARQATTISTTSSGFIAGVDSACACSGVAVAVGSWGASVGAGVALAWGSSEGSGVAWEAVPDWLLPAGFLPPVPPCAVDCCTVSDGAAVDTGVVVTAGVGVGVF